MLQRSLEETATALGEDEKPWRTLFQPLLSHWPRLKADLLGPLHWPSAPLSLARFGLPALLPASTLARLKFRTPQARALFAGIAAHSILPLTQPASSAIGLVLALAGHSDGWPLPRGGSGAIARALASCFESLGGRIVTSTPISFLAQTPPARVVLFDLTPRQILRIAGERFTGSYSAALQKYRYGPGVSKSTGPLAARFHGNRPSAPQRPRCISAANWRR